jgi:hypothetical protein
LDYEKIEEEDSNEPFDEQVYCGEHDLSRGIEGEDYDISFGAQDKDVEGET